MIYIVLILVLAMFAMLGNGGTETDAQRKRRATLKSGELAEKVDLLTSSIDKLKSAETVLSVDVEELVMRRIDEEWSKRESELREDIEAALRREWEAKRLMLETELRNYVKRELLSQVDSVIDKRMSQHTQNRPTTLNLNAIDDKVSRMENSVETLRADMEANKGRYGASESGLTSPQIEERVQRMLQDTNMRLAMIDRTVVVGMADYRHRSDSTLDDKNSQLAGIPTTSDICMIQNLTVPANRWNRKEKGVIEEFNPLGGLRHQRMILLSQKVWGKGPKMMTYTCGFVINPSFNFDFVCSRAEECTFGDATALLLPGTLYGKFSAVFVCMSGTYDSSKSTNSENDNVGLLTHAIVTMKKYRPEYYLVGGYFGMKYETFLRNCAIWKRDYLQDMDTEYSQGVLDGPIATENVITGTKRVFYQGEHVITNMDIRDFKPQPSAFNPNRMAVECSVTPIRRHSTIHFSEIKRRKFNIRDREVL